jgi:hypothetical protein
MSTFKSLSFLEGINLEEALVQHGCEFFPEEFQMFTVWLQISQKCRASVKSHHIDNLLCHKTNLCVRTSPVRCAEKYDGVR